MAKYQPILVPAAVLAQRVLDVCTTNDNAAIDIELKQALCHTRQVTRGSETTAIEAERRELVRAIAMSMNRKRKMWNGVVREPRFGVWVNLLRHLSAGESVSSSTAPVRVN